MSGAKGAPLWRGGQEMKIIAVASLFACLIQGALGDDQSTPTPTPFYPRYVARPSSVRRMEQLDRWRTEEAQAASRVEARAQARASRRSTAAEAQTRAAESARERAQHQVDAEARRETATETPHATSELMKRMGFSSQEIAAQKALEEPAKHGASPSPAPAQTAAEKPASASPAPDPGSH